MCVCFVRLCFALCVLCVLCVLGVLGVLCVCFVCVCTFVGVCASCFVCAEPVFAIRALRLLRADVVCENTFVCRRAHCYCDTCCAVGIFARAPSQTTLGGWDSKAMLLQMVYYPQARVEHLTIR